MGNPGNTSTELEFLLDVLLYIYIIYIFFSRVYQISGMAFFCQETKILVVSFYFVVLFATQK